jgi:hypothetical protein
MGWALWQRLPAGLLKKKQRGFLKLDEHLQALVVELAEKQNFKCVFCAQNYDLIIEHDHEPEGGTGERPTIYNARGLVCSGCNHHIKLYEMQERGEYHPWENVYSNLSDHAFESYKYTYDCRVDSLLDALRKKRMGSWNYWRRSEFLYKFDDWSEWGSPYPWQWGFEEIKERRHGNIRTPRQAIKALIACMQFVVEEKKRNPDWEIPEQFISLMVRLKPLFDELRPRYERLKAAKAENIASAGG